MLFPTWNRPSAIVALVVAASVWTTVLIPATVASGYATNEPANRTPDIRVSENRPVQPAQHVQPMQHVQPVQHPQVNREPPRRVEQRPQITQQPSRPAQQDTIIADTTPDSEDFWNYGAQHGPKTWGNKYPLCHTGKQQSPIDLQPKDQNNVVSKSTGTSWTRQLTWQQPRRLRVHDNGAHRGLNLVPCPSIPAPSFTDSSNRVFQVEGLQIRTPAEHRIAGVHADMELQMRTHLKNSPNQIFMFSILWKFSSSTSGIVDQFWSNLPNTLTTTQKTIKGQVHDHSTDPAWNNAALDKLFSAVNNFSNSYKYVGSLTSPPCTEGVTWIVANQVLPIHDAIFNRIRDVNGFNARPLQDNTVRTSTPVPAATSQDLVNHGYTL